jgi:serine/threonine-protein kinase RsbW
VTSIKIRSPEVSVLDIGGSFYIARWLCFRGFPDAYAQEEPLALDRPIDSGSTLAAEPYQDVVQIRLPAVGAYLSLLRTATAGLAARLDFTLDDIEDLRIAVDEACAMLLAQAAPGASLDCSFELLPEALKISVAVVTTDGQQPSRDTFAWTVLSALAGDVDSSVDADNRVTISLQKHRPTFAAGTDTTGAAS